VGLLVLASWGATSLQAESLGSVARREKARREKARATKGAAEIIDDEKLANTTGQISNDPSLPPAVMSTPDLSSRSSGPSGRDKGEDYWRGRSRAASGDVTRLEAEVARLEAQADRLAYGASCGAVGVGPGVPVGATQSPGFRANAQRMADAACQQQWESRRKSVMSQLESARSRLAAARTSQSSVAEEARKGGALPGWTR